MAKKSIWLKRSFFGPMVIFYLVLLLFFGIMQQSKLPAAPLIGMQISSIFITYFFSFLYSKKSIAVTCTIVFFFQLICSLDCDTLILSIFTIRLALNQLMLWHIMKLPAVFIDIHCVTL